MLHVSVSPTDVYKRQPMGVATYDNIRLQEIKSQLPSEEAIQKRLEQAEEEYILKLKEKNK